MTLPSTLLPPVAPSADCSLDRLIVALEARFRAGGPGRGKDIAALLAAYAANEASWRPYVTFRDDTYSRNLIWRTPTFELLLLGWNRNQESPIHDHAGQDCWMAVLEGELEEVHYEDRGHAEPTALSPGRVKAFAAGGVAYISDDIALHLIRPKTGTRGVSLHLYARPIESCRTFCPETGRTTDVDIAYHSVRGTPCAQIDADTIRAAWTPHP